jgi:acyl-CoA synthetase (AMP-forming)/AMP-acid ligase II
MMIAQAHPERRRLNVFENHPQRDKSMPQAGLMMNRPMLISGILEHGAAQYGDQEIVSRETHGPLHRYTYADAAKRSRQLANALAHMGLKVGSAVGSIAWNNHRHLEAYYAVSGSGMVMHTCNPRLHPQQLIYVINHACLLYTSPSPRDA